MSSDFQPFKISLNTTGADIMDILKILYLI